MLCVANIRSHNLAAIIDTKGVRDDAPRKIKQDIVVATCITDKTVVSFVHGGYIGSDYLTCIVDAPGGCAQRAAGRRHIEVSVTIRVKKESMLNPETVFDESSYF